MYDGLIWWLTLITPGVLLITFFIWRMEIHGTWHSYPPGQENRRMSCSNKVKMTVNTGELYSGKRM
jgi:hypothetical protein